MCSPIEEAMRKLIQSISEAIAPFAEAAHFMDEIEKTGWLPYESVPLELVDECEGDIPLLDHRLCVYYKENWDCIRQEMELRLKGYAVSEENRETFGEALSAHGEGFYRCVCRVLFPEIERVFRMHFFQVIPDPSR